MLTTNAKIILRFESEINFLTGSVLKLFIITT